MKNILKNLSQVKMMNNFKKNKKSFLSFQISIIWCKGFLLMSNKKYFTNLKKLYNKLNKQEIKDNKIEKDNNIH